MSDDPRVDPQTANILDNPDGVTYGKRSVNGLLFMSLSALAVLGFCIWLFIVPHDDAPIADTPAQRNAQNQALSTYEDQPRADQPSKGLIVEFIDEYFNGGEPTDMPDMDSPDFQSSSTETASSAANQDISMAAAFGKYSADNNLNDFAITSAIGKAIYDMQNLHIGTVYDIVIDQNSGQASAIIMANKENEGNNTGASLLAFNYDRVRQRRTDGAFIADINTDSMQNMLAFTYDALDRRQYTSLRDLQGQAVLDFENREVGTVQTVIYRNGKAEGVYIKLADEMVPNGEDGVYALPYDKTEFTNHDGGTGIKLTKTQTTILAEDLYAAQ